MYFSNYTSVSEISHYLTFYKKEHYKTQIIRSASLSQGMHNRVSRAFTRKVDLMKLILSTINGRSLRMLENGWVWVKYKPRNGSVEVIWLTPWHSAHRDFTVSVFIIQYLLISYWFTSGLSLLYILDWMIKSIYVRANSF